MRVFIFLLFVSIFFVECSEKPLAKAEKKDISVVLNVIIPKNTDKNAKITLAGNHAALGEWQPDRVLLTQKNDTLLQTSLKLPQKYAAEFKITRGSWQAEAVTSKGEILQNHKFLAYKDTVLTIKVANWKDIIFINAIASDGIKRQITGNLETIKNMAGLGIKSRNVHIWLPSNYETDKNRRFPVIYIHDGQNCFDPKTATNGVDWQLDETADSLIRNNVIEPFIMVAMDCTADRYEEYGYGDLGRKYRNFIKNQVKPMIDKRFRTKPDAANTIAWGSSMGGLCAFEMLFEDPETFGMAACFSPAFKVVNHTRLKLDYVKTVQTAPEFKYQHLVYIDNGTQDLEAVLQPGIDDMLFALTQKNIAFTWFLDEGATHNETAWGKRVWRPLVQFFARKK